MVTVSDIEDKQRAAAEDSGLAGYAHDPQGADALDADDPETNAGTESKTPSSDTTGYTRTRAEQEEEERLAEEASIRRRREKDYASFTNTNQDDNPTGKTGFSLQDEIDDVFKMSWLRYRMHGILKYPEDGRLTAIAGKDGQLTDKQLRVAIIGMVREFKYTKLYAYRGNSIDPQLSQRMQSMLDDLTKPGHILQDYRGKVAVSMSPMEGLEPWKKYKPHILPNFKNGELVPGILKVNRLISAGAKKLGQLRDKTQTKAGQTAASLNESGGRSHNGRRGLLERIVSVFAPKSVKKEVKTAREERKLGKQFRSQNSGKTLSEKTPVNTYGAIGEQVAEEKRAKRAAADEFNHMTAGADPASPPPPHGAPAPDAPQHAASTGVPKDDFGAAATGDAPQTAHHATPDADSADPSAGQADDDTREHPAAPAAAKPVV